MFRGGPNLLVISIAMRNINFMKILDVRGIVENIPNELVIPTFIQVPKVFNHKVVIHNVDRGSLSPPSVGIQLHIQTEI